MATYNGEKYIRKQIKSILQQLDDFDELVISDDGSTDGTLDIINEISAKFLQIKLVYGPQKGVFKNFENAINHCSGDIVFLSDQDDIWIATKVEKIKKIFEQNRQIKVILHNAYRHEKGRKTDKKLITKYKSGFVRNLLNSSYFGCCMAFRKKYIEKFMPFNYGIAHDQLIGLFSEKDNCTNFIDECLIYHRYHEANVTKKLCFQKKIYFRIKLFYDFCYCYSKRRKI